MSAPPPAAASSSMPKKKDPRLRAAQAQGAAPAPSRQYFDSVEYEVKRQQASTQQQRDAITNAARSQPHAGLPSNQQMAVPLPPPHAPPTHQPPQPPAAGH